MVEVNTGPAAVLQMLQPSFVLHPKAAGLILLLCAMPRPEVRRQRSGVLRHLVLAPGLQDRT